MTALIVPSLGQGLRAIIDPVLKKRGAAARPRLEMDALTPTLELVKSGAWATILPVSAIAHELDAGALSVRRIHADMQRQLVVVNHPRRPLSLAAQRFVAALRSGFERELEASQQRVQDAMEPFIRHVRSEIERLRGQAYELGARRKDVEALRGQIAAMR